MTFPVESFLKLFGDFIPSDVFSAEELTKIANHLSRKEESKSDLSDQWGNWDVQFSHEPTEIPHLDRFILQKLKDKGIERKGIWPNNKTFAVCLSHDVDRVESYSATSFLRNLTKRYQHNSSVTGKLKLIPSIVKTAVKKRLTSKSSDPLWHYEKWIEIETKYDAKSTYFFFVRPQKRDLAVYDCDYSFEDRMIFQGESMNVAAYIKKLKELGFEIGLHGSYNTFNDQALFNSQNEKLKKIIQSEITATRQHYLHFNIQKTPVVHSNNGITCDSTIGFNSDIGFRAGTSFPFYIQAEKDYILEIPLILMDSALYFNDKRSLEAAKIEINKIIDEVEQVGGCLTVNFHPDYLNDERYFGAYEHLLKSVSARNCIFMTMSNIQKLIQQKCAG
jgi:hypothetical protein